MDENKRVQLRDLLPCSQLGLCAGMTCYGGIGSKHLGRRSPVTHIAHYLKSVSVFPNVVAMEQIDQENTDSMTTMDRLQSYKHVRNWDIENEIQEYLAKESGQDRLKKMFSKSETGKIHPELFVVFQMSGITACIAAMIGAVNGAKEGREKFVEKHKMTKWKTKFLAARAYQDNIIASAMKQAAKNGFRYFIFCGLIMGIGQSISVYRNKSGLIEYPISFGICGILWRMNLGVRGMLISGGLGMLLGTVAGAMSFGIRVAAGDTTEQRHSRELKRLIMDRRDEISKMFGTEKSCD